MDASFIAGAIGKGMNSFVDSYQKAEDRKQKQVESDELRALRRRQAKREEYDSGIKYNDATDDFERIPGVLSKQDKQQQELVDLELKGIRDEYSMLTDDQKQGTLKGQELLKLYQEKSRAAQAMRRRLLQGGDSSVDETPSPAPETPGLMPPAPAPQRPPQSAPSKGLMGPSTKPRPSSGAPQSNLGGLTRVSGYQTKEERNANKENKLPASDVLKVSEGAGMPALMEDLANDIQVNKGLMGPVQGLIGKANPYNTEAQTFNAKMTTAAQRIGKYLEGGVLRAEDVPKYRAMLPQITDTPEVAEAKRLQVQNMLEDKQRGDVNALKGTGYNIGNIKAPAKREKAPAPKLPKVGQVEDGHRFLGGDPSNAKSWEKVK